MKICYIDDSCSGNGGTKLTLDAIVEPEKERVTFIQSKKFSLKYLNSDFDLYILGNNFDLSKNSFLCIQELVSTKKFVKINFDYGYCKNRGPTPHRILSGGGCDCHKSGFEYYKLFKLINDKALHIFYMSKNQRAIHSSKLKNLNIENTSILSSCFTQESLDLFKKLKPTKKNNKYAIIDGNGGWHTQAKGVSESISYAQKNKINFEIISSSNYYDFIKKLSKYHGLIFLPIIEDTCPRVTLESRYMGLDLILNENCQHTTEEWWQSSDQDAFDFTASRPNFFWEFIKNV